MSNPRVIKKYPNRRLYDTEESRYITLADIKDLVMNKVDFEVIDKKSGEDITRTILLQVISEQEQHGDAIMTEDFLAQIIRAYGSVVPDFMARYLEQSMSFFMKQQKFLQGQVKSVVGTDPISAMAELTQKNIARLQSLQEEMLKGFSPDSDASSAGNDVDSSGDRKRTGSNLGRCNGDLLPRPPLQCLKGLILNGRPPAEVGGHFFVLSKTRQRRRNGSRKY
jgi:polyhydroxyalkanoate synthesis repressor PhaR